MRRMTSPPLENATPRPKPEEKPATLQAALKRITACSFFWLAKQPALIEWDDDGKEVICRCPLQNSVKLNIQFPPTVDAFLGHYRKEADAEEFPFEETATV